MHVFLGIELAFEKIIIYFFQVKHIRSKYGDYFGITVAGYPGKVVLWLSSLEIADVILSASNILRFTGILIYTFMISEAHPDMIKNEVGATEEDYQKDLAYLKLKVL